MRNRFKVALAVLVVMPLLYARESASDQNVQVHVTVSFANWKDAPLQIAGFRLPAKIGDPPRVVVRNESQKETKAFWIDAVIGASDVDSRSPGSEGGEPTWFHTGGPNLYWPEERIIPPGGSGEVREIAFRSTNPVFWAKRLVSNCLHVCAVVRLVEFEDGTSWTMEGQGQEFRMWKESLASAGKTACDDRPATREILRGLGGGGHVNVGSSSKADPHQVESYAFTCPVRRIQGKLVAMCPF